MAISHLRKTAKHQNTEYTQLELEQIKALVTFDTGPCMVDQLQTILAVTVLTFKGTKSQKVQNGGSFHISFPATSGIL